MYNISQLTTTCYNLARYRERLQQILSSAGLNVNAKTCFSDLIQMVEELVKENKRLKSRKEKK